MSKDADNKLAVSLSSLSAADFPDRCFFVRVTGNHFAPCVPHASEILVERTHKPRDNDLVLVLMDGSYDLKRVFLSTEIGLFPELPTDRQNVSITQHDLVSGRVELYRILKKIVNP